MSSNNIFARAVAIATITMMMCLLLIFFITANRIASEQLVLEQLATEHGIRISNEVSSLLFKAQTLASFIILNDGDMGDFPQFAPIVIGDNTAILNLLIAPDGIVSGVYPIQGNELLLGLNFFQQETLYDVAYVTEETRLLAYTAKDTNSLVFGGPFTAVQGGEILVSRMPVFMEGTYGNACFWGITGVTLRFPEVLAGIGLEELPVLGYGFEIWRENPDTLQPQIIISSEHHNHRRNLNYVEMPLSILNATWYFRLFTGLAWYLLPETWIFLFIGVIISSLVGIVAHHHYALKKAKDKIESFARMKSEFLATMSHEMKTPLYVMSGFAELALCELEDDALSQDSNDNIRTIALEAQRLSQLVDGLLGASTAKVGLVGNIRVEVHEIIRRVTAICEPLLAKNGNSLDVSVKSDCPPIKANPDMILQVLVNLVGNANRYIKEDTVKISVCRKNENMVMFGVEDRGEGVKPEIIKTIFRRGVSDGGGMGLGLPICKEVVEAHGGAITIESTSGSGTLIAFTLPIYIEDEKGVDS